MRSLLIAVALIVAPPLSAQEEVCDAEPRWLVVALVGSDVTGKDGESIEAFKDRRIGDKMLDRCGWPRRGVAIKEHREFRPGGVSQSAIFVPFGDADSGWRYERLYVRQSVQDICAALNDCGDAIEASQGPPLDLRAKPN